MTILPELATADSCPICRADHMQIDEYQRCPHQGHRLEYGGHDDDGYRYYCPAIYTIGCRYERHFREPLARKEPLPMTTTPAIHHPQTATPATELAIREDQQRFDKYQLAALRQLNIIDAPNAELAVFFHYCKAHHLDPFSRHVTMIKYGDQWTIQVEIDGYRFIGHRAANRRGNIISVGAPTYYDMDGNPHRAWVRNEPPGMVEVTIVKDGAPFTGQANYFEFVQVHGPYLKGGKPNPKAGQPRGLWEKMPANQTRKCAEAQAWRMAYQDEFADIPTELPIEAASPPAAAAGRSLEVGPADRILRAEADGEPPLPSDKALDSTADTIQRHFERIGIEDPDEQMNMTAALAGLDYIPDTLLDFGLTELQRINGLLKGCEEVGQVHALLTNGDAPGGGAA